MSRAKVIRTGWQLAQEAESLEEQAHRLMLENVATLGTSRVATSELARLTEARQAPDSRAQPTQSEQPALAIPIAGNSGAGPAQPESAPDSQEEQENSMPVSDPSAPDAAPAPPAGDSSPPVEIAAPTVDVVAPVDVGLPTGPDDAEVIGEGLRAKTVGKVEEIAERFDQICGSTPQELDAARSFTQDLKGRHAGWRLMVDVSVKMRRSPA